jgi:hypothetical protein
MNTQDIETRLSNIKEKVSNMGELNTYTRQTLWAFTKELVDELDTIEKEGDYDVIYDESIDDYPNYSELGKTIADMGFLLFHDVLVWLEDDDELEGYMEEYGVCSSEQAMMELYDTLRLIVKDPTAANHYE